MIVLFGQIVIYKSKIILSTISWETLQRSSQTLEIIKYSKIYVVKTTRIYRIDMNHSSQIVHAETKVKDEKRLMQSRKDFSVCNGMNSNTEVSN